ncbi:unnamed protein product [Amoebophrya sp. A120]|nr:unnamed protein product [Amoebophrya sp. A120]|eukprot:GSA120T00018131001.1
MPKHDWKCLYCGCALQLLPYDYIANLHVHVLDNSGGRRVDPPSWYVHLLKNGKKILFDFTACVEFCSEFPTKKRSTTFFCRVNMSLINLRLPRGNFLHSLITSGK